MVRYGSRRAASLCSPTRITELHRRYGMR